jgi:ribosome assembly protein 3
MATKPGSAKTAQDTSSAFTAYYLQRATTEFAEDLDKVRVADDFKNDAVPLLVNALQQGTALFSAENQRRVVDIEPTGGNARGIVP